MIKTGVNNFKCINTKNLSIAGNYYGDIYQIIDLLVNTCNNDTYIPNNRSQHCKSRDEIS